MHCNKQRLYSITASARASRAGGTSNSERLRRLEVDYELEFGRCLHRKVARLFAAEDAINVRRHSHILIHCIGAIGHEAATFSEKPERVYGREPQACRCTDYRLALGERNESGRGITPARKSRAASFSADSTSVAARTGVAIGSTFERRAASPSGAKNSE